MKYPFYLSTKGGIYLSTFGKEIQDVRINDGKFVGVLREMDKSRVPSDKTIFQNGMGYLTSFAAKEGFENVTNETAISFLDIGKKYTALLCELALMPIQDQEWHKDVCIKQYDSNQ